MPSNSFITEKLRRIIAADKASLEKYAAKIAELEADLPKPNFVHRDIFGETMEHLNRGGCIASLSAPHGAGGLAGPRSLPPAPRLTVIEGGKGNE